MILKSVVIIALILASGCSSENQASRNTSPGSANECLKNLTPTELFCFALKVESSSPAYVVFKAQNINTKTTKEMCAEIDFFEGAIHTEYNMSYETVRPYILNQFDKTFNFQDSLALANFGFFEYPAEVVNQKNRFLDSMTLIVSTVDQPNSFKIKNMGFYQQILAHRLFNMGIPTQRGSIIGDLHVGNPIPVGSPLSNYLIDSCLTQH